MTLLRELVETNQWPLTSPARASVIGNLEVEGNGRAGYSTLVSEGNFDFTTTNHPLPKLNALFPDLMTAVFDLERSLISAGGLDEVDSLVGTTKRDPFSHCVISCNAQLTPHVDSGRRVGQSLSMTVVVEGDVQDIQYRPLQFDGWKL